LKYLSIEQILLIHSLAIDETGGVHGVRDLHAILSLEELPRQKVFGKELYPTIFEKAALYTRNIIMNHPFIDGNKRTGMTAAAVFLENNSYEFVAKEGEIENFALKIVKEKLDVKAIASWLKRHSKKHK
jgi:death-on-curing protein